MTGLKDDLLKIAKSLGIKPDEFEAVGIYEWPAIMKKIEEAFVIKKNHNTRFNWWWESFKEPQYGINVESHPYDYLHRLIDKTEKIWFVACDSNKDPSKFWLFQGYIEPIQKVLDEHYQFEFYIVSKKYEWLLCVNHHDNLIGLGSIISKLQLIEKITRPNIDNKK